MGTSFNPYANNASAGGLSAAFMNHFVSPMDPGAFSLTPDALLTYCQTRLQGLDSEIKKYIDDQKTQLAKKEVLQKLETAINDHNTVDKDPKDVPGLERSIADAYAQAYKNLTSMGMNDEAAALHSAFAIAFPNGDITQEHPSIKGSKIPTQNQSAFNNFTQPVQDMIDEIGKNAELNMIQLQSLMSQRQTAVQLTTNMMSKLDRGFDSVTANFK